MSSSGRWGIRDEIHFIERGYKRKRDLFIKNYRIALKLRVHAICGGGAMHAQDRKLLEAYCSVVPFCSAARFIERFVTNGEQQESESNLQSGRGCPVK